MYLSLQIVVNFESAYVAILVISVRHLPSTVNYLKYLICTSITFYTSNSNVDNISTPSSSWGRGWYCVAIALILSVQICIHISMQLYPPSWIAQLCRFWLDQCHLRLYLLHIRLRPTVIVGLKPSQASYLTFPWDRLHRHGDSKRSIRQLRRLHVRVHECTCTHYI